MTYILKSNKPVVDNNGRFPYVTPLGITNKYVSAYYSNMEKEGYTLTLSEFNALNKLTETLIESGAIDSIIELYPIIGDTMNSALTKLKFKNSSKLSPVGGLSEDNFDGKGLVFPTFLPSGAKAAKTELSVSDIFSGDGFGVSAYVKYNDSGASNVIRMIMGASANNETLETGSPRAVYVGLRQAGVVVNKFLNSQNSVGAITDVTTPGILTAYNKWNLTKSMTQRGVRFKGVSLGESSSSVAITPPDFDTDFYVGASHAGVSGASDYGWHGHIRFVSILNGSHDTATLQSIEGAINTFVEDTEKNIF